MKWCVHTYIFTHKYIQLQYMSKWRHTYTNKIWMHSHITHKIIHAHTNINIYTLIYRNACTHAWYTHIHTCTQHKKTTNKITNETAAWTLVSRDSATSSVSAVTPRVLCGGSPIIQTLIERETHLCHMLHVFLFNSPQSGSQYKLLWGFIICLLVVVAVLPDVTFKWTNHLV